LKIAQVQQQQMVYKATIEGTVIEVNSQEGNLKGEFIGNVFHEYTSIWVTVTTNLVIATC